MEIKRTCGILYKGLAIAVARLMSLVPAPMRERLPSNCAWYKKAFNPGTGDVVVSFSTPTRRVFGKIQVLLLMSSIARRKKVS
jgi:hypothetical protein